ncbi:MAG: dicarboxylate/amino acid:cation symporter [Verrucomicrobia bacterium]|nr:dicarboxylate/amino acid:cation symporter [Verrucomicrobiota bacterium]
MYRVLFLRTLTGRILFAMVLGILTGVVLSMLPAAADPGHWLRTGLIDGLFHVLGRIFLAGLSLLVVPLVFVSLVCGTAALEDIRRLGRVGLRTVGLYLMTTAIAITLAMTAAVIIKPGSGFDGQTDVVFTAAEAPRLIDVIIGIFPRIRCRRWQQGTCYKSLFFRFFWALRLHFQVTMENGFSASLRILNVVIMKLVLVGHGVGTLWCVCV